MLALLAAVVRCSPFGEWTLVTLDLVNTGTNMSVVASVNGRLVTQKCDDVAPGLAGNFAGPWPTDASSLRFGITSLADTPSTPVESFFDNVVFAGK